MKNKIWDVVPATNFIEVFIARTNHALIGLTVRSKKIIVKEG